MMKQLVLDIRPDAPPTLENFVAGSNAELVATVSLLADPTAAAQLPARHIYLWGGAGSGAREKEARPWTTRRAGTGPNI